MSQRKRIKKIPNPKYYANVFSGVLDVLKFRPPKTFPNDIFTMEYIFDTHKSSPTQIDFCDRRQECVTPKLSSRRYEKLISLIAKAVRTEIRNELDIHADIFSLFIDFFPDTDESAIYIRYVNDDGIPIKRFLDIINKKGDNVTQIMDIIHLVLDEYDLNHDGFMGLSYDVDSKLPRQISGLKSSLKVINRFAEIIPCSSDSLSSVMVKAASTFYEGNAFITTIDELFNFLLTFKYELDQIKFLLTNLSDIQNLTKNMMLHYLNENWSTIVNALLQLSENMSFLEKVRIEACILLKKVKRLEICILAMFWEEIMEKSTEFEDKLHLHVSTEIDFEKIFEIYQSLANFLNDFRTNEKFMDYKTRAFKKSNILHFNNGNYIAEPQMRFPVNYKDDDYNFKTKTYFSIIDQIQYELDNRKNIYKDLAFKFNFLNKIPEITNSELNQKNENLLQTYHDLTFHIDTECMDLKNIFRKYLSLNENYPDSIRGVSSFIRSNGFKEHFSQLFKVIKMALSIPAINCPVQQPSSVMKNFKTSLETTTNEETYKSLLLINLEWQFLKTMDFDSYIKKYARRYK